MPKTVVTYEAELGAFVAYATQGKSDPAAWRYGAILGRSRWSRMAEIGVPLYAVSRGVFAPFGV